MTFNLDFCLGMAARVLLQFAITIHIHTHP